MLWDLAWVLGDHGWVARIDTIVLYEQYVVLRRRTALPGTTPPLHEGYPPASPVRPTTKPGNAGIYYQFYCLRIFDLPDTRIKIPGPLYKLLL